MSCLDAQILRQHIDVTDNALFQGTPRLANPCTVVRHSAGSQPMRLQERQGCQSGFVLADTRVVEDAQQRSRRQRVTRRTDAAVGTADSQATRILRSELRDRIDDAKHGHRHFCLAKAACVMADKVPRVVITSGSSITSISVPCGRASAASSSPSNSSVRVMRTPA